MNDDMSDLMAKLNSMLGSDSANGLKDMINNFSNNNSSDNSSSVNNSSGNNHSTTSNFNNFNDKNTENENSDFNIDFDTIMKMKSVMDAMNSKKNDPRAKLLMSLKPYLKDSRKQKLDQYVQLLNMSSVFELFKENGGDFNSNSK